MIKRRMSQMRNETSTPLGAVVAAQSPAKRPRTWLSATACVIVGILAPRIAAAIELLRPRANRGATSKLKLAADFFLFFFVAADSCTLVLMRLAPIRVSF